MENKARTLKYVATIVATAALVGPKINEYVLTPENFELFIHYFIASSGILASTATIFTAILGNPKELMKRYLSSKYSSEHSVDVLVDKNESSPINFPFGPGLYSLKFNYNDHSHAFVVIAVESNKNTAELASKTSYLATTEPWDFYLEMKENKLWLKPLDFFYGTVRISKL